MLRRLGQHEIGDRLHPCLLHQLHVISLPPPHGGARDHHLLHPLPAHPSQIVGHEATVARPQHGEPLQAELLQHPGDGSRLEELRPLDGSGGGAAKEDEVGDVDVEVGGEGSDLVTPLPDGGGAEAVDED